MTDFSKLDKRITKALNRLEISKLTKLQEQLLSTAHESSKMFVCSAAGSGKTLGCILLILREYLKRYDDNKGCFSSFILVPTKDCADQTYQLFMKLGKYCPKDMRIVNLVTSAEQNNDLFSKSLLSTQPDVVISTPKIFLQGLNALKMSNFRFMLIIDGINLMTYLGHQHDLSELSSLIHSLNYKCIITSDAPDEELKKFSQQFLFPDPLYLDAMEYEDDLIKNDVSHYAIHVNNTEDKHLVMLVILKLRLLNGRIIIFTSNIQSAYKLHVFLHRFDVHSDVLNPAIPKDQANYWKHNIVITIDGSENSVLQNHSQKLKRIDSLINFDLPKGEGYLDRYISRSKVTASNAKSVLNFFCTSSDSQTVKDYEEKVKMQPFQIQLDKIEGFRYRVSDVWNSITRSTIREAQLKDFKTSLLKSEKLKEHFSAHPEDLKALKSGKKKRKVAHIIKHVPEYCITKISDKLNEK